MNARASGWRITGRARGVDNASGQLVDLGALDL